MVIYRESVAGSVIQATGRTDFEDGSRTGTKLEVRNGLQSVRTIPEVNMVSPLGPAMTPGGGIIPVLELRQTKVQLAKFRAISAQCSRGVTKVNVQNIPFWLQCKVFDLK